MMVLRLLMRGRMPANLAMLGLSLASGLSMTAAIAYVSSLLTGPVGTIDHAAILVVIALAVAVAGTAWVAGIIGSWVVQANASSIRLTLATAVLRADYARLEQRGPAVVMDLLSSRLPLVLAAAGQLPGIIVHGAVLIGLYGWMLFLSPLLAGAIIVSQAVFLVAMAAVFGRLREHIDRNQHDRETLTEHFTFIDAGRKYLSLYPALADDFLAQQLSTTIDRVRRGAHRVGIVAVTADSMAKASFFVTLAALLAGVATFPDTVPATTAMAVLIAFLFSLVPSTTVLNAVQVITEGEVACRAIIAATEQIKPADRVDAVPSPPSGATIELSSIRFRYTSRQDDRDDGFEVSIDGLHVVAGEVLTITGPNGSGKSTVGKLVTGLFVPHAGQVEVAGLACDAARLRGLFAAVWCDDRHMRFHIGETATGFGSAAALWAVLGLDAVQPLEAGWIDCSGLSTGQRMRIALVSALSCGRRHFLFDEFAANQDEHFAGVFYDIVIPALRRAGCGIVIIAHDRQAVAAADCVRVMAHGRMQHEDALTLRLLRPVGPALMGSS